MMWREGEQTPETRLRLFSELRSATGKPLQVSELAKRDLDQLTGALRWSPADDGMPVGVRVSFGGDRGPVPPLDVVVGIGGNGGGAGGLQRVQSEVTAAIAAVRDKEVPLVAVQISIRNRLARLSNVEVRRIVLVQRQGSGAMQLTWRGRLPSDPWLG